MTSPDAATPARRFGPIRLMPGVTPGHTLAFLFGDYATIGFITFFGVVQTYLLNVNLGVPATEQGTLTGDLGVLSELIVIALSGACGVLADTVGRRIVYAGGIAVLGLAYLGLPSATAPADLYVWRVVYAAGVAAAACMLTVIVHDYPEESSRGKLVAASGIFGGFGAASIPAIGRMLPGGFEAQGFEAAKAGAYTAWVAGLACVLAALAVYRCVQPGVPGGRRRQRPPFSQLMGEGLRAARNPRVALAYASAFTARGDLVISAHFLVLWGTLAGRAEGMDAGAAVAKGTLLMVIATGMALLWAPVMGFIMDRINRVSALVGSSALAAAGFISVGFIDDPLEREAIPLIVLLGIGQASCLYASQALIGQEAGSSRRGAIIGVFSTVGALGVLLSNAIGGRLFDQAGPGAPFLLIGGAAVVVALWALVVRLLAPGAAPGAMPDTVSEACREEVTK